MIPRIVHQTAPDDISLWPKSWHTCQKSVLQNMKGFEYRMWNDNDLDDLIREKYPWFYDFYKSYPKTIHRVDAARYAILQQYGGIYMDMDIEVINDFYSLLPVDCVSIVESCFPETETAQNSIMASMPNDNFWTEVFREMIWTYPEYKDSVIDATGPRMLDRVIARYPKHVNILPKTEFNPHPTDKSLYHKLYTRHHYTAVWM